MIMTGSSVARIGNHIVGGSPAERGRGLVGWVGIALVATLAWWLTLFWARRPALDWFCVGAFLPVLFAGVWLVLGWRLLMVVRRDSKRHRTGLIALMLLALFLGAYSLLRAGSDMFTLSVRYHLWRAGGVEKVRGAFNEWVATRPVFDESDGRKLLFGQVTSDGSIVPLPVSAFPPEVRYMHERFPSRFGVTWNDVARLDDVSVLTTTDIMIGPAGWEPEGGATAWDWVTGRSRKVGDGIWVWLGTYNK